MGFSCVPTRLARPRPGPPGGLRPARTRGSPPSRRGGPGGFTFVELVVVLGIAAVLLGIAAPRLSSLSGRVAVRDARSRVTAAVSSARAAAVRHGRTSTLVFDAAGDRLLVRVDTAVMGGGPPIALFEQDLWEELGVNLMASHPALCFDPRGLAVASAGCADQAVVVRLARGATTDSLTVSAVGRVSR